MNDYLYAAVGRRKRRLIPDFFSPQQTYTDQSVLGLSTPAECYNFDCSTGALTPGAGLKAEEVFGQLTGVKSLFDYIRFEGGAEETVPMCALISGEIMFFKGGEVRTLAGVSLPGKVLGVNYRLYGKDVILLCSSQSGMAVWDGESPAYTVEASPKIGSLCMHYERMFVTGAEDLSAVRFSDDLDPTNWAEELSAGGFIGLVDELGKSNRVLSFLNYVYVFRDRGISRITAYANQTEFSAVNLFVSSGRIYPGSVALCGDAAAFLASDGMYIFNGLTAERVAEGLLGVIEGGEYSAAAYSEGKYYLSLRLKKSEVPVGCEAGEYLNNGLVIFDLKSGRYTLCRGMDISGFCASERGLLAVSNGRAARIEPGAGIFGQPLPMKWASPFTDLGSPETVKTALELYADTDGELTLSVRTDQKGEKSFFLSGPGIKRLKVNLRGRRISISVSAPGGRVRLSRPALTVSE